MDTIILVVGIVVLCVQLLILVQVSKKNKQGADDRQTTDIGRIQTALEDNNRIFRKEMTESVQSSLIFYRKMDFNVYMQIRIEK